MTVFLTAHRIMAQLNGVWTDLTAWVVDDITGQWGIQGNGPRDLVADPGFLHLTLNNMDGRFTPGTLTTLAGWKKNIPVRLEIDFDGATYVHNYMVEDIVAPIADDFIDQAFVTITDWLEDASVHPIINPGIMGFQRADDAIRTLLSLMPMQPEGTDLDVGTSIFPTTFDTIATETKAMTELGKYADSEVGTIHIERDGTLRFENSISRHGERELDGYILPTDDSGYLLKEDGGKLLKEDGGALKLDGQTSTLCVDNEMLDIETDYGKKGINYFKLTIYPRRLDATPQVLFYATQPIAIASGQTIEIKGNYVNPNGGGQIDARDMIAPDSGAGDYRANTMQDGTGTDITSSISIVTGYGANGFTHQVTNTGAYSGWITQFMCRGTGIYMYNPLDTIIEDADSVAEFGYLTETLDQKYQATPAAGLIYVNPLVDKEKQPRTSLNGITILANQSAALMTAFLNFGTGKLIRIKSDRRNIDGWFYIQGVKNFSLSAAGMIKFAWIVKEAATISNGKLSRFSVDFSRANAVDCVSFGDIPAARNLAQVTYAIEFTQFTAVPAGASNKYWLGGLHTMHPAAWEILIDSSGNITYYQKVIPGAYGSWSYPGGITLNTPKVIYITRDNSDKGNLPYISLGGASTHAMTEIQPQGADIPSQEDGDLCLGNLTHPETQWPAIYWAFDGKIKRFRIFNRILADLEIWTNYLGLTPFIENLVFDSSGMPTSELALNQPLTDALRARDLISGAMGVTGGAPVIRSF